MDRYEQFERRFVEHALTHLENGDRKRALLSLEAVLNVRRLRAGAPRDPEPRDPEPIDSDEGFRLGVEFP